MKFWLVWNGRNGGNNWPSHDVHVIDLEDKSGESVPF